MLTVYVNRVEAADAVTREEVERAVAAAARAEGIAEGEMSITFIDAGTIADLNETHLNRSGPTDVIAFNLGEPREPLGDVYVCPDVARDSAERFAVDLREELLRLVVHGALHIFGYEHPGGEEDAEGEMLRRQETILSEIL